MMQPASQHGTPSSRISFVEAFWMPTAGGAQVLDAKTGLLAKNHHYDAIVVEANKDVGNLRIWSEFDSPKHILEKIICLAQKENVKCVWVQDKLII
ncbi:hypothetical protein [Vibrio sp. DNB22_19_2]